ncbi:MAG: carboxypeptidase regulatory-like domain-containing protein [Candidatus Acidiferrales bacterium]
MKAIRCLCLSVLVFAVSFISFGQAGRGSISGTVTDPSGAAIQGAQITLLNTVAGVTQHTTTNSAGLYNFVSLNPGVYQITVNQTGFATSVRPLVGVDVDQVTQVNVTLKIGRATETVTVREGAQLVEPSNSTVGSLITSATIDRVPLVSRNVYDLVQLSAGVNAVNGSPNSSDSMQSIQNISNGRPGVDVSADTFNGSLVGSVYYMLDGTPLGIAENNSAAIIPAMSIPEDGIDEVRVETQNTPASYQSGGAGVISLVSKSGTNQFHGDAFGVFRPNVLAANDYFNKRDNPPNTPPSFYRYQEGAAIGGPIKKDKLFFFGDYEDTQEQQFEGEKGYSVPTTAERTGDFSQMGFTIYDPTLPDNPDGTRQAFPGNIIPNPNPIALLYLSKMPHCNFPDLVTCDQATTDFTPVPNFEAPGLDPLHAHKFDVRVDWNKSERQHIFGRFSYDRLNFSTANVFPSGWDPDYAQNVTNGRNVLIADDLTIGTSTALQLRYSFTRHHENQGGPASYLSTDITNLGSVNGTTAGFPSSLAAEEVFKQLPFMNFADLGSSVGGTADYNNFVFASENSDANATVTKIMGRHTLSFGFEWMKRYLNVGQPPAPAGTYCFDISATDQSVASATDGSDFASFLVGMATAPGGEGGNGDCGYPNFTKDVFAAESNPYYASFFEDTFHASKNLTVTAGLRWDIFGGRNERHDRQEYFDPAATNTVAGVSYTGAEVYVNSNNRSPFTTNLHDFGPRLAVAWQPFANFVVRAGAGIYYGPSTQNVASAGINTDGFSSQTTWNGTCFNPDGNSVFNTGNAPCVAGTPDSFTVPYSLSNPFPNGVVPVLTSPPSGLANNLGIVLNTVLHSQRTPTTYNYNFGLEYELPRQVVVSAAYVGSRGLFIPFGNVDLNQLDLATIAQYGDALCISQDPSCQVPNQWEALYPSTNLWYQSPTVPQYVALAQYPQFGDGNANDGVVISGYPAGDSEYNSLQTKVQKRLTNHFTMLSSFTWGKLMTDDGNPPLGFVGAHNGAAQDWRDLQYEHSISPQDIKYSFTGQISYDLPVGNGRTVDLRGVPNAILGGWTLNGILYISTGVPINAPSSGTPNAPFNQRADMVCNPASGAPHTPDDWFNDSCFVAPETGGNPDLYVPGTAPDYLDNVRTRGARDLDISIYKAFKLTETKELRFDVSSYNIFNYAQWGYPNIPSLADAQNGASFGVIGNDVNSPRQFQFGARFIF